MEHLEAPRKRRRPPKACEQCRKRKVRCDQSMPCNQCTRLDISGCSYDNLTLLARNVKQSRHHLGQKAGGTPPTPVSTIDQDGQLLVLQSTTCLPSSTSSTIHSPTTPALIQPTGANHLHPKSTELLEDTLLHVGPLASDIPSWSSQGQANLHGTVTKTRLLGRSHWINIIQEFEFVLTLQSQLTAGDNSEIIIFLNEAKKLGRKIKTQILSELRIHTDIRHHIPTKAVADALLDNYFRVYESCFRILHIPSFMREYEQFWVVPDAANSTFIIKLLLILAIGACLCEKDVFEQYHRLALQWIKVAQAWLNDPFAEKSKISVSSIQIYCLLLLAREVNSVSPDLIWVSAGSLLRISMLAGLHRDPSRFPRLPPFQSEIRRRLWATVMELCLQSSMNGGGSPMISADCHDCQPPANLDDSDMDVDTGFVKPSKHNSVFTQTSLQRALMQTMAQRCRIAQLLNDFKVEQSFSETLELGSKLSGSLHKISSQLRASRRETDQNDTATKMYELMTYRFLLSLHQTYAIKALRDPVFYFSRKVCLDTCLLIASATFAPNDAADNDSDYRRIVEVTSGTVKNVIMLAFLFVSLELVKQLEHSRTAPPNIAENLLRQEMFRVLDAYSELTLIRIEMGETNIKGYLFSTCGLAKLRSLVAGDDSETRTLEAGMEALKHGINILRERLDRMIVANADALPTPSEQQQNNFDLPIGDDLGWDDWDPDFNLEPMELFFPQP